VRLPVAERLGLPLVEAHAVAQPLAVGDRVEDAQTVAVPDALAEPVEDKQREGEGLTVGLSEGVTETEAHALVEAVTQAVEDLLALPLEDPHGEALPVGGVDRVPVAQTETVSETLGDAVEDRQREDVGLTLGLRDED
jgi:hypothetical protein